MTANEIANAQELVESIIQPTLVRQQKMAQELAEQVLQPALIEQQKALEQALKPGLARSLIERQKMAQEMADQILQPTLIKHQKAIERAAKPVLAKSLINQQKLVQKMAEQVLQPAVIKQQKAIEQAIKPTIRHQKLVEQMVPAIELVQWDNEVLDSPEVEWMVADFEEATRPSTSPRNVGPSGTQSMEWGLTHSMGFFVITASYMVDQAIEERGLDGAVSEVKRRRWILRLVLTLLAIYYYADQL